MKSGVSLQQMLTEVKRQSESKEDYLIAPNRLRMESYGKEMFLHLSDDSGTELIEPMTITGIAHRQIGTHLRIPAAYYDRMREERPDLLAYNANTWFKQENSQRMLRTLDGSARAYLSNRYRRIDNIDIAGVTLPILGGLPDIRFESCQITESRMYIKAVNPRLQAEVSPGDIVQAGVIISNSEVGLGSVSIQPLIYRLVCSNGMVVNKEKQNTDPILSEGESVRTKVRDNIELDLLCHNQPESAPVMQEIYELVVETIQLRSPVLRLGNNLFPMALVRERLLQLTSEHIRFVLDGLRNLRTDVKNLKKYLLTMLFNAPVTLNGRTMLDVRKSVNSGFRPMLA